MEQTFCGAQKKELEGKVEEPEGEEKELETEPEPSLPKPEPPLPEQDEEERGVSADDGKDQQHFEQSLGKRTEKKEKEKD
jgi:hypothetical protein